MRYRKASVPKKEANRMQGRKKKPVDVRKAIETMLIYVIGVAVVTV